MPVETAEQAAEVQADAQITDQGAERDEGQQAQGAEASEQQVQASTDDGADYVRVARRNFAHLATDGDFNKVISGANQAKQLEQQGYAALAEHAKGLGLSGYALLDLLMREDEDGAGEVETQAAAQPAAQSAQRQPAASGGPGYVTQVQVDEIVAKALSQAQQTWDQKQTEYRDGERQRADRQAKIDAEGDAYTRHLGDLGFKENPQTVNIEGSDHELDVNYQFNVLPRLQALTQWLVDQELHPDDPDYYAKRSGPVDPEVVARAAAILKPFLTLGEQRALEHAADQQADLPDASLASGPAGRAQPDPSTLTPEQAQGAAFRRQRAKGTLHAEADR